MHMARLARIVIPHVAHHVTQRGNRRLPVFFSDDDRQAYLALLADYARETRTRCLAWCLMDNHVHLVLVPHGADGLRAMLGEAHRRYTRAINFREGWRGHLFQARFASYPMDDAHLMIAVRYVEQNPVAAGLVTAAADWHWSSARSHIAGKCTIDDPLTDVAALSQYVPNWRAMLRHGVEAGELSPSGEDIALTIESRLNTGRPLAVPEWIADQEARMGRHLSPQRPGPKPKRQVSDG
jgi:putative transposase